jgi:hypothetical protein
VAYRVAVGANTTFYVGKQVTRGTQLTLWSEFEASEIISLSIEPVITTIPDPSLYSGVSTRAFYAGGVSWQGTLKVRANYLGTAQSILLGGVLGTNTAGAITESSTQAYLSFIFLRGGMEDTPLYERLSNICMTGFSFKCAAGTGAEGMGTFEFSFIASTYTSGLAALTGDLPTAPATSPVLFRQANKTTWCDGLRDAVGAGAIAYRPKAIEIDYRVPLEPSNFIMTSATSLEPARTGLNTCTVKFEESLMSVTPIVAASTGAANSYKLCVPFVSGATSIIFEAGSSASARVAAYSGPVEGYGEVRESITWNCGYNATEVGALKITNDYTA